MPIGVEMLARRIDWYQGWVAQQEAHSQAIAAMFGRLPLVERRPPLIERGCPDRTAIPWILRFASDLYPFAEVSEEMQDIFADCRGDLRRIFQDTEIRENFCAIDAEIARQHFTQGMLLRRGGGTCR